MTRKLTCHLPANPGSYEIEIGSDLLLHCGSFLHTLGSRFVIIASNSTAVLYGESLLKSLSTPTFQGHLFYFPNGEKNKTRATKEALENQMLECGLGRDTCLIALGGGVVTDLAGYIAATYCRGIPFLTIPTTLLGMVDASIGGKTGVNTPYGKNMLGCIYRPKKVLIDLALLKTLPVKELSNGVVEMIKYGLIASSSLFEQLEKYPAEVLMLNSNILEPLVFESCRIKKEIVEQDENERGKRRLLNYGHTIGHALELVSEYKLSHGEAVAIGLIVESHLSVKLGYLEQKECDRIRQVLLAYGLPLRLTTKCTPQTVLESMRLDKKAIKGKPRFPLIDTIGASLPFDSSYCTQVDESCVNEALQWMMDDLCCH